MSEAIVIALITAGIPTITTAITARTLLVTTGRPLTLGLRTRRLPTKTLVAAVLTTTSSHILLAICTNAQLNALPLFGAVFCGAVLGWVKIKI